LLSQTIVRTSQNTSFPKILRWANLGILLFILLMLLKPPTRLSPEPQSASTLTENANSFQTKLGELQREHEWGHQGAEVSLSSEEVGAALAVGNSQPQARQPNLTPAPGDTAHLVAKLGPEQVPVKDAQVIFEGDELKGQFSTQVYGKEMFVTLSGHVGAKDGYVTFNPTSFKIGSLPMPIAVVQKQLDKKFNEPETREKLKLPEFVSDLKIENGQLVIVEK
jgi:hypothetical protein